MATSVDVDMLWRLPPSLYPRLLFTGEPFDRDYIRHLVDDVVLPLTQPR